MRAVAVVAVALLAVVLPLPAAATGSDSGEPLVVGWPVGTGELAADGRVLVGSRNMRPEALLVEVAGGFGAAREAGRLPVGGQMGTVWGSAVDGAAVWFAVGVDGGDTDLWRWQDGTVERTAAVPTTDIYEVAAEDGTVWLGGGRRADGVWRVDADGQVSAAIDLAGVAGEGSGNARGLAAEGGLLHVGATGGTPKLLTFDGDGALVADRTPEAVAGHDRTTGIYTVDVADGRLAAGAIGTDGHTWLLVGDAEGDGPVEAVRVDGERAIDQVAVDGATVYATSRPDGHLWRLRDRRLERIATPVPGAEARMLSVDGDGSLVGVASEGVLWRVDPERGTVQTGPLTARSGHPSGLLPAQPHLPMGVGMAGGHLLAGGNSNATVRLPDGTVVPYDLPGEPKDIAGDGLHAWLALYPSAELWMFRPGSRLAGGGLQRVARWDPLYNRPTQVAVGDGHVLVAVHADSIHGGALVRVDGDGALRLHGEVLGAGMSAEGLAAGDDGIAYVAGGMRRGRQHDGWLPVAAVDSATGAVRWRAELDSDARRLRVAVAGDHVAVVNGDRLMLLDRADGAVADEIVLPSAAPGRPASAVDGDGMPLVLLGTEEGVAVVAPHTGSVEVFGPPLTVSWPFGSSSPAVGCDGTVYVGDDSWLTVVELEGMTVAPERSCR